MCVDREMGIYRDRANDIGMGRTREGERERERAVCVYEDVACIHTEADIEREKELYRYRGGNLTSCYKLSTEWLISK